MADQGAEGLLSPFLRNKRFSAARPFLKGRVLDYGCGSGGLAEIISADRYLGIEIDRDSLQRAQSRFPDHRFISELPERGEKFDTVVSLAVIEHVKKPANFLQMLASQLNSDPTARVVVTTPYPAVDWVHDVGAAIGLFSKHANEEHEDLLDRAKLETAGSQAGLKLILYKRFLFGANQLAVFRGRVHER
jgi:SAM-dependent methyltransferase